MARGDFPSVLSAYELLDFSTGQSPGNVHYFLQWGHGQQGGAGDGSLVLFLSLDSSVPYSYTKVLNPS